MTTEENKGSLPTAQDVEVHIEIPQTTLLPGGLSLPEEKDTVMEGTPEMIVSYLGAGLLAFLVRFDSLEFNSLPTSHFHRFGRPYASFLQFSMPTEGLPLLEGCLESMEISPMGLEEACTWQIF